MSKPAVPNAPQAVPAYDPCRGDISEQISTAFQILWPQLATVWSAAALAALLEKPPDLALGDFAFPCFRFAKDTKLKPQEVADTLAKHLTTHATGWIKSAQVAAAFVNISVDRNRFASAVLPGILSGTYFDALKQSPERQSCKVMIEYSQPNTHKEFHVGHARNVCLGGSLVHLFRACGYPTVAANYFGDEGTHIAKALWLLKQRMSDVPTTGRGEWLATIYVESTRLLSEAQGDDKTRMDSEISAILRGIEQKSGPDFDLWMKTRQWSLDEFKEIYQFLDAPFDKDFYESEVSAESQAIVDEFLAKGVFVHSDGAIGADLKEDKLGFALMRKRDGNTLYATKDLALARRKFEQFNISRNIYVVADEQNLHFRQVFKVLEKMGFPQAKACHHVSYGLVMLPEGKMASRKGTSVTFNSLRRIMLEKLNDVLKKYEGTWSTEEIAETARRLCVGAMKYGMLSSDPVKNLIFELDDWISFEGNTGPYLMYSYTRTQSILRKGEETGFKPAADNLQLLTTPEEHDLLRYLYDFNDSVLKSCENYKPSTIANHLFYMCKEFNRFYSAVSVLKADTKPLAEARLALVAAFGICLNKGLGLLGITPPARM